MSDMDEAVKRIRDSMDDMVVWLVDRLDDAERRALGDSEFSSIEAVREYARHQVREVEATRRLIKRYELVLVSAPSVSSYVRGQDAGYREACLDALRDAAERYADQPDYREEWRPEPT